MSNTKSPDAWADGEQTYQRWGEFRFGVDGEWVCPLIPIENWFDLRIEAGEKDFPAHH